MYNDLLYDFDRNNERHPAKLADGAYLYRLTSLQHCGPGDVLAGGGTLNNPLPGRFNSPHQLTSYCANNVLVCIAEVLYHMYRNALDRIEARQPANAIRASLEEERVLVIIRVSEIDDLVYADAEDVSRDFDQRMCGTTIVFPDPYYKFLWDFNNQIRSNRKRGVFYPSARHSKDLCVALFYNETARIQASSYDLLNIKLQLIPEDQDLSQPARRCRPFTDKLHPTMGYYSFADAAELTRVCNNGGINPANIPAEGKVDFVRRFYYTYPNQAVC